MATALVTREDGRDELGATTRRGWLASTAAMAAGLAYESRAAEVKPIGEPAMRGRIRQSVVYWCFKPMPLETLCKAAVAMGVRSVELVPPSDWPLLKRYNLVCALTPSHGFVRGLANKNEHAECLEKLRTAIDASADAGFPSVITFSGMRHGQSDEEGIATAVAGFKQIVGHAEKRRVTLCLEVLNSRVNVEMKGHPGYMCDKVEWAAEVCNRLGSERLKILFDIYHVQIMQGDLITRIRQYKDLIGHYHTAGVPGRNEIDQTQEINYPAVMQAIAETNFGGYVAQEFIPRRDPLAALRQAVELCDV